MKSIQNIFAVAFILITVSLSYAGNIESTGKLAWSENAGWINFAPLDNDGVTVTDDVVSGYAWCENIGWINLSPEPASDLRGVKNDGDGNLSGYAWGENTGWIKFDEAFIDPCTGVFGGKAWGENTGWVNFEVTDTSKKVVTTWRKDTDSDGTPDCTDQCPDDATKTEPGACGCGVAEADTDSDGTPDCNDQCPEDALKTEPGICGCGVADTDTDGDGIPDCNESEPTGSSSGGGGSCFIQSLN